MNSTLDGGQCSPRPRGSAETPAWGRCAMPFVAMLGAVAATLVLLWGGMGTAEAATSAQAVTSAQTVSGERVNRAVNYLRAQQNTDGGFGEAGERSDPTLTAWVTLALDAAGLDVGRLERGGATLAAYLARQAPTDVTGLELQLLARSAAGVESSALATALVKEIRPSGRIGSRLNSTIWGILALGSARLAVPKKVVRYVRRNQHKSGGFSWIARGPVDTNDTAAAIQALRSVGVGSNSKPIKRAFRFLASTRRNSGGFPLSQGGVADAQSTGWVLQAYAATGRAGPSKSRRFLVRLQQDDGRLVYRRGRAITPVWVTAQALPGLLRSAFPPGR